MRPELITAFCQVLNILIICIILGFLPYVFFLMLFSNFGLWKKAEAAEKSKGQSRPEGEALVNSDSLEASGIKEPANNEANVTATSDVSQVRGFYLTYFMQ